MRPGCTRYQDSSYLTNLSLTGRFYSKETILRIIVKARMIVILVFFFLIIRLDENRFSLVWSDIEPYRDLQKNDEMLNEMFNYLKFVIDVIRNVIGQQWQSDEGRKW